MKPSFVVLSAGITALIIAGILSFVDPSAELWAVIIGYSWVAILGGLLLYGLKH